MIDLMRVGVTLWLVDRVMPGLGMLTRGMRDFGRATESTQLQLRAMEASIMRTQGRALGLMYPGTAAQRKELQAQMLLQDASMKQQKMAMIQGQQAAEAEAAAAKKRAMVGAGMAVVGYLGLREITHAIEKGAEYQQTLFSLGETAQMTNAELAKMGPIITNVVDRTIFSGRQIAGFASIMASAGIGKAGIPGLLPEFAGSAQILSQLKYGGQDPGEVIKGLAQMAHQLRMYDPKSMGAIVETVTKLAMRSPEMFSTMVEKGGYVLPFATTAARMDPTDTMELIALALQTSPVMAGQNMRTMLMRLMPGGSPKIARARAELGLGHWYQHPTATSLMEILEHAKATMSPELFSVRTTELGMSRGSGILPWLADPKVKEQFKVLQEYVKTQKSINQMQTEMLHKLTPAWNRFTTNVDFAATLFGYSLVPNVQNALTKLGDWASAVAKWEAAHPTGTRIIGEAGGGLSGLLLALGTARVGAWLLGPTAEAAYGKMLATAFAGIGGLPVWGTIGIAIAAGFLLYWADKKYGAEIGKGIDKILPAPGSTAGRGAAGFADWLARTFGMPGMPGTGAAPATAHRPGYKPAGYFEDGGGGVHIAAGAIEININKVPGEDVDKLTDRVMVRLAKMLRDAGMRGAIGSPYGIGGPVMAPGTSV